MNIEDFLNSVDTESARRLGTLISTGEGKELLNKLKSYDKYELLKHISKGDTDAGINQDIVRRLISDPNLIKKLKSLLDGK